MKSKLKLAVYGIAVIAALSSCNKEQPETLAPVSKSLPKAMTITAGTDAAPTNENLLDGIDHATVEIFSFKPLMQIQKNQ